ncbi:hypothetical protein U1Q18_003072, partial [Sarracenia purpurea var. burkii]
SNRPSRILSPTPGIVRLELEKKEIHRRFLLTVVVLGPSHKTLQKSFQDRPPYGKNEIEERVASGDGESSAAATPFSFSPKKFGRKPERSRNRVSKKLRKEKLLGGNEETYSEPRNRILSIEHRISYRARVNRLDSIYSSFKDLLMLRDQIFIKDQLNPQLNPIKLRPVFPIGLTATIRSTCDILLFGSPIRSKIPVIEDTEF